MMLDKSHSQRKTKDIKLHKDVWFCIEVFQRSTTLHANKVTTGTSFTEWFDESVWVPTCKSNSEKVIDINVRRLIK